MKRFTSLLLSILLTLSMSFSAFAGVWKKDNIGYWYLNDNNTYYTSSWQLIDGKWYYFNENGYMLANTWLGEYYLGNDGAMLVNTTTPDGHLVDSNGKLVSTNTTTNNQYTAVAQTQKVENTKNSNSTTFILNANTYKFHLPSCSYVKRMKESNKISFHGTIEEAINKGYDPCKRCLR